MQLMDIMEALVDLKEEMVHMAVAVAGIDMAVMGKAAVVEAENSQLQVEVEHP